MKAVMQAAIGLTALSGLPAVLMPLQTAHADECSEAQLQAAAQAAAAADSKCGLKDAGVAPRNDAAEVELAVYDPQGKFICELKVPRAQLGKVQDCNEGLGLLRLAVGQRLLWIDRNDVKVEGGKGKVCIRSSTSRPADTTAPVGMGAGESCEAEQGAK